MKSLVLVLLTAFTARPAIAQSEQCAGEVPLWDKDNVEIEMVVTGTADTVPAGYHTIGYLKTIAGYLPFGPMTYGQKVDIHFSAIQRGATAERSFDTTAIQAVLVYWRYDKTCKPVPFDNFAEFLEVGEEAFVVALNFHEREYWLEGLPTFYVFPYSVVYRPSDWVGYCCGPPLSAAEFAAVFDALPPNDVWEDHRSEAVAIVREWLSGHHELLVRPPIPKLLATLLPYFAEGSP